MTTTAIPKDFSTYTIQPRRSTETDRRHLLAPSIVASSAASTVGGTLTPRPYSPSATPRAGSPAPTTRRDTLANPATQPYRGFPSEAHYLAALNAWAEEKKYIHYDRSLVGFYGAKTTEDYLNQPKVDLGMNLGLREKWRARKRRRKESKAVPLDDGEVREGRRNTVA